MVIIDNEKINSILICFCWVQFVRKCTAKLFTISNCSFFYRCQTCVTDKRNHFDACSKVIVNHFLGICDKKNAFFMQFLCKIYTQLIRAITVSSQILDRTIIWCVEMVIANNFSIFHNRTNALHLEFSTGHIRVNEYRKNDWIERRSRQQSIWPKITCFVERWSRRCSKLNNNPIYS